MRLPCVGYEHGTWLSRVGTTLRHTPRAKYRPTLEDGFQVTAYVLHAPLISILVSQLPISDGWAAKD